MKRVTGLGGIFFKSEDPKKISEWYGKHLGFDIAEWGGSGFSWKDSEGKTCYTAWSPFKNNTDYFAPSEKPFMFNYRVENLEALLQVLREEGVEVMDKIQVEPYGKFGWIMDPEGNKIELWEPIDEGFSAEQ